MTIEQNVRIKYLDGWRGIAVLAVIVSHFSRGTFGWPGAWGVELFFALSGMLMGEILFVRHAELKSFFVRRFSRVYPALFVFAIAMFVASTLASLAGLPAKLQVSAIELIAALTFWTNYQYVMTGEQSVLIHIWSLCVEESAYVLLALISLLTIRHKAVIGITLAVSTACMLNGLIQYSQNPGGDAPGLIYWRTDVRLGSIFLSTALFLVLRRVKVSRWISPASFVLGAMIFAFAPVWLKYTLGTSLIAISINTLAASYASLKTALANGPLVGVGLFSYSLYLWQQPFWKLADKFSPVVTGIALLGTIVVAYVSFRFVEGPARDFINKRWTKRQGFTSPVLESDITPALS